MKTNKRNIIFIIISALTVVSVIICVILYMTDVCGEKFANYFSICISSSEFIYGVCITAVSLIKNERKKDESANSDLANDNSKEKHKPSWREKFDIEWDAYTVWFCVLIFLSVVCIIALTVMFFNCDLTWGTSASVVSVVLMSILVIVFPIGCFIGETIEAIGDGAGLLVFYIIFMLSLTVFLLYPIPILYAILPIFGFLLTTMIVVMPLIFLIRNLIKKDTEHLLSGILAIIGTAALSNGSLLVICFNKFYLLLIVAGTVMNIVANLKTPVDGGVAEVICTIVFWVAILILICVVMQIVLTTIPTLGDDIIAAFYKWCDWIKEYWWHPWIVP